MENQIKKDYPDIYDSHLHYILKDNFKYGGLYLNGRSMPLKYNIRTICNINCINKQYCINLNYNTISYDNMGKDRICKTYLKKYIKQNDNLFTVKILNLYFNSDINLFLDRNGTLYHIIRNSKYTLTQICPNVKYILISNYHITYLTCDNNLYLKTFMNNNLQIFTHVANNVKFFCHRDYDNYYDMITYINMDVKVYIYLNNRSNYLFTIPSKWQAIKIYNHDMCYYFILDNNRLLVYNTNDNIYYYHSRPKLNDLFIRIKYLIYEITTDLMLVKISNPLSLYYENVKYQIVLERVLNFNPYNISTLRF